MKKLLWLDDVRNPFENNYEWLIFSPIDNPYDVIWVKSYIEFVNWIEENGLPEGICFDHDLGWDENNNDLKSGFDCTKWLIEYCIDRNLKFPNYNIQSANPVGKQNIEGLIQSFIKYRSK